MDYSKTLLLACATVIEEILAFLPEEMDYKVFEFGLHVNPGKLRETLQIAITELGERYETIILGYGLCSLAIVGIKADGCRLVVPKVDDCISIFLGSRKAYNNQTKAEPGTYYLTKGWIEVGDTPFSEYDHAIKQFGKERADRMYHIMMRNYNRLALIDTGQYELEKYRDYAEKTADKFNLQYEEISGSDAMVRKMIFGPWDDEFVVINSGETFVMDQFYD